MSFYVYWCRDQSQWRLHLYDHRPTHHLWQNPLNLADRSTELLILVFRRKRRRSTKNFTKSSPYLPKFSSVTVGWQSFCVIWLYHWAVVNETFILDASTNKRPKGSHIVHLSTMCHLFDRTTRTAIFVWPENTNLVYKNIEILLSVKFRWILYSGFRGEVENVSANQRPWRPSCFFNRPEKHKLGRGRCDLASCHV